jgi:hypothetical protein
MALGNDSLDVEKVLGWEMGYKGNLADNAYVSIDLYLNKLKISSPISCSALTGGNSPSSFCPPGRASRHN